MICCRKVISVFPPPLTRIARFLGPIHASGWSFQLTEEISCVRVGFSRKWVPVVPFSFVPLSSLLWIGELLAVVCCDGATSPTALLLLPHIYGGDTTTCGWLKSYTKLKRIKIGNMKSTGTTEMITLRYDGNLPGKYSDVAVAVWHTFHISHSVTRKRAANTRQNTGRNVHRAQARRFATCAKRTIFRKVDLEGNSSFHSIRSNRKRKWREGSRKKWNKRTSCHAEMNLMMTTTMATATTTTTT